MKQKYLKLAILLIILMYVSIYGLYYMNTGEKSRYREIRYNLARDTWEKCLSLNVERREVFSKKEGLSLITLNHLIVDDHYQVLFCYVPKVSSTQWKKLFYVLKLLNDSANGSATTILKNSDNLENLASLYSNINGSLVHERSRLTFLSSFLNQPGEVRWRLKRYKKFMFVRDPLERLLSAYLNKFGRTSYNAYFERAFGKYIRNAINKYSVRARQGTTTALYPVTFADFITFILDPMTQKTPYLMNEHWIPYTGLCDPCHIKYDMIGKQESLSVDGLEALQKFFNIPKSSEDYDKDEIKRYSGKIEQKNILFQPFKQRNGTRKLMKSYYSNVSRLNILKLFRLYRDDYFLLNYNKSYTYNHLFQTVFSDLNLDI